MKQNKLIIILPLLFGLLLTGVAGQSMQRGMRAAAGCCCPASHQSDPQSGPFGCCQATKCCCHVRPIPNRAGTTVPIPSQGSDTWNPVLQISLAALAEIAPVSNHPCQPHPQWSESAEDVPIYLRNLSILC